MIFCPKMSEVASYAPWLTEKALCAFSVLEEVIRDAYKESGTGHESSLGLRGEVNVMASDTVVSEAVLCSLASTQSNLRSPCPPWSQCENEEQE